MFREIILPIFRSTRYNAPTTLPAGVIIPQTVTQSSAPEDGQNIFPKHVELTGIINRPLLLHIVGCLYYLYFIIFFETC